MRIEKFFLNLFSLYIIKPLYEKIKKEYRYEIINRYKAIFIKILIIILNIFRKNLQITFFVMGTDEVNWSVTQDRKYAIYFLKLNKINLSKNLFKCTHIFHVSYHLLASDYLFWVRALKSILDLKVFATVTNDIRTKLSNIEKLKDLIDIWVVPSTRMFNFLKKKNLDVILIPFFVDEKEFYKINTSKKEICKQLNIDYSEIKDRIVIGSFQRDSIVSLNKPKWQKDPDLLVKILRKIPSDKYILLLSGPRRHYLISECNKYGLSYLYYGDFTYIEEGRDDIIANNHPLYIINLLYNLSDIYIITSRNEGGPKAIMEASYTKTLIFSTDVGLAKDFIHKDLIYSRDNVDKIIQSLINYNENLEKIKEYLEFNYKSVKTVLKRDNYKKFYIKLLE